MAGARKSANVVALGNAMRSARRERGHNQESFAAQAGLDRSYYGAVERDEFNVTVKTVAKIAEGLHLSVSELFAKARL